MDYLVALHRVRIMAEEGEEVLDRLLPSFRNFETTVDSTAEPMLAVTLRQHLKRLPKDDCRLIDDVDTGNGVTRVEKTRDGGYQMTMCDLSGYACALLQMSADFSQCQCALRGNDVQRMFGMNSIMMISYAFRGAMCSTVLLHASVVRHQGRAYAFTAKSGTGKSTQVANWLRNIDGCDLINDDNPIVRLIDGRAVLFGSPWSGKTPCYRNVQAPLGAILKIVRDTHNHVEALSPVDAFVVLLEACSTIKTDKTIFSRTCDIASGIVAAVTMASLHCLPDAASAEVCRRYLED